MPRRPSFDKDDLIRRARDLFWRKGWAGTSMKDLEVVLQLNPGSIYAAFGSKEALYEQAMLQYMADGTASLEALANEHGPLAALQRYPRKVIDNDQAPARACMIARTFLELSAQDHALAAHAHGHLTTMEKLFTTLFEQAIEQGTIGAEQNPSRLAKRYQSDLLGLRLSSERPDVDGIALADEIATDLARL